MRSGMVSAIFKHIWDGDEAHVKLGRERVKDLVRAHMGIGVNDTLAAALHGFGCVWSSIAMANVRVDCALPLRPMLAGLGERFSRFGYGRLFLSLAHRRPPSGLRIALAGPRRPQSAQFSSQLIDAPLTI
jgi:hypothetical protein